MNEEVLETLKVVKRNGKKVDFDTTKVAMAIKKGFDGVLKSEDDEVKYVGVENIGVGSFMNYVWPKMDKEGVDTYFLLIGTNNVSRPDCDYDGRENLEELVMKIKEFIDIILASRTGNLIVQSIYPTKHSYRISH